ncbi:protein ARABIDILLO 1-like, partial [Trifolium pratense]
GVNEGRMRNLVSSFPEIQDEVVDLEPQDRASLSASCKKWRVLGNSPCLWTSLDLRSHKFDVNVASSLASRCVHLQKLRFGVTGTKAAEALPHLRAKNLRELSVEIWDADIEAAFIFARHELLQSLQFGQDLFGYNSITSDGIIAIARGCPSLNQLRLAGIVDVNADAINALATYCPKLTDIGFIDCDSVDELALGNVQSVRFLSVAGTLSMKWSVVSHLWHKLPNLTGLDVSGTDIGPSAVPRLLSLSLNLKILIALSCRILEEETSFSASKYKNKLLISLSTDIFKGLGSLFFDNTNRGNNVFLDWRTSKSNNDKGVDEIIPWLEWMLSYNFFCSAAESPQQGGLDNFWVEQVASLLVCLMQSSQEDVQEMAATGLATFVLMDDSINCGRAEAVIRYGGIRLLLGLAKSYREGLQLEAAEAIARLSTSANVAKAIVEE